MRIRFADMDALVSYGSMGEGMEECLRDSDLDEDIFAADQVADVVQSVWTQSAPLAEGATEIEVEIDDGCFGAARSILENVRYNEEGSDSDVAALIEIVMGAPQ